MVEVIYMPQAVAIEIKRDGVGEIRHYISEVFNSKPHIVCFGNGLVLRWTGSEWFADHNPRASR